MIAMAAMMFGSAGLAADLIEPGEGIPVPPVRGPEARDGEMRGIWGAIAYSRSDDKHGFFWGADKKPEAEEIALEHCENAGGSACEVVTVFRNHRHWNDDDGSGFPYAHCGVLAVGPKAAAGITPWAAASATTRKAAEEHALRECQAKGAKCEIREWVCT